MSGLEKLRLTTESTLRKVYRELEVLTAEDDYDAVASGREHLKSLYLSFRSSHSNYHVTLQDEVDIKNSNAYLYEVQQQYIKQQKAAKAALNDMRPQQAMDQEYSQEQSFKTLSHLINLPSLELRKFSGEPEEFDDFLATFNEVIGNVVPDPAAKLVRLNRLWASRPYRAPPPPPRMIEGGFIFFVWVSSVTKIISSKKKGIM